MKNIPVFVCSIIVGLFGRANAEEPRVFESKDGQEIVASILAVSAGQVYLERSDGKTFTVSIDRFSAVDVAFINKWAEQNKGVVPPHLKNKKPRIRIGVSSGKTNKADDQISGYIDERKQKMKFVVTLENNDAVYPVSETTVTLLVAGRGAKTGKNAIVYKQVFDKVALPLNHKVVLKADPFELWYDDKGSAMYGYKYKGYFVFVQDPQGKFLAEATIPSAAARYLDAIQKLKAGDLYDRSYASTDNVSMSKAVKKK